VDNTTNTKSKRILLFVVLGAVGFSVAGAMTVAMPILLPAGAGIAVFILVAPLRDWKRGLSLAVGAGIGCCLSFGFSSLWLMNMSSAVGALLFGAFFCGLAAACLGWWWSRWKGTLLFSSAAVVGVLVAMLTTYATIYFQGQWEALDEQFRGYGTLTFNPDDAQSWPEVLKPWVLIPWGAIEGAFIGAAAGFVEKTKDRMPL